MSIFDNDSPFLLAAFPYFLFNVMIL